MGNRPLVSIVIPVYNGSNYLKQAIDSALAQTYPGTEVLVINDGSTDCGLTEKIALNYGARIRYFSKPNGGVSSALNLGLEQMRGKWFAWLSHDDMITPNRIADDVQIIDIHPDARVIFCRIQTIDAGGRIMDTVIYPIEHITNPREALALGGVHMCAMTIQRNCFEVTGLFNEMNRTAQDTEMTLKLATAFPFFLNPSIGLYSREHKERGKYTLKTQHRQDLLGLCRIIHDELTLKAFFPNLSGSSKEQAAAWTWMGSQYLSFGSKAYAYDAFDNAWAASKTPIRRILTFSQITVIRLVKSFISEDIRGQLKVFLRWLKANL